MYCQNCGKAVEYSAFEKPNFCPGCGTSFNSTAVASSPDRSPVLTEPSNEDQDVDVLPNINKLDVHIEHDNAAPVKFESLLGSSREGDVPPENHSVEPLSHEQLMESFKREASSLRKGRGAAEDNG